MIVLDELPDAQAYLQAEAGWGGCYWCPNLVPAPLQTATYARAVLDRTWPDDPAQVAEGVRQRGRRTHALYTRTAPRRFLLTMEGLTSSKHPVGGTHLMRQFAQMGQLYALEHVQMRVLTSPVPEALGPYTLHGPRVVIDGPAGPVTLPASATGGYRAHFERLWEVSEPYTRFDDLHT